MKKRTNNLLLIILALVLLLAFVGCEPAGTLKQVNTGDAHAQFEVYKYYYDDDGSYVFISRFKDQPNVQTTTTKQLAGETLVNRGNIVVYENDSIVVTKKILRTSGKLKYKE